VIIAQCGTGTLFDCGDRCASFTKSGQHRHLLPHAPVRADR
jgi:hypothetical protein